MENNKNKKSVKCQGDMLNFYDFNQVFVFTTNHHLNPLALRTVLAMLSATGLNQDLSICANCADSNPSACAKLRVSLVKMPKPVK